MTVATVALQSKVEAAGTWRSVVRAMGLSGGASLASGLLSMAATKIVAVTMGPEQVALLGTLTQLRQSALTAATLTGQTALVQGASATSGVERREFLGTAAIVISCTTAVVMTAMLIVPEWICRQAGLPGSQAGLIRWLVLALLPATAYVFLAAVMNAAGAIGSLTWVQLAGPASMAVLAYLLTQVGAWNNGTLFVGMLVLSSSSAALAAGIGLYRMRREVRGWFHGSGRWWNRRAARRFLAISGSMFASGIVSSWVTLAVRGHVLRSQGLAIGGQFDAAWSISMSQTGLVLASLQTYYLPALARTRDSRERSGQIGRVLMAATITGALLIGTLIALMPFVIATLYSPEFLGARQYLRWTLAGDYLKITSWILSVPLVASANMRAFLAADLSAYLAFAAAAFGLNRWFTAAESAAIAFVVMYVVHATFCGIWLGLRGEFPSSLGLVATWIAGLASVAAISGVFWT